MRDRGQKDEVEGGGMWWNSAITSGSSVSGQDCGWFSCDCGDKLASDSVDLTWDNGINDSYPSPCSAPWPLLTPMTVVAVWPDAMVWPEVMGLMGALTKRRDS